MDNYILKFKGRTVARGDLVAVLLAAASQGAFAAITPSQRGYKFNRILCDLKSDYEIVPPKETENAEG